MLDNQTKIGKVPQKAVRALEVLHNDSMTVSIHPALTNLIEEEFNSHKIRTSEDTINALNILQKTQWSINLDFLDFIAYFTYEGENHTISRRYSPSSCNDQTI